MHSTETLLNEFHASSRNYLYFSTMEILLKVLVGRCASKYGLEIVQILSTVQL